MQTEKVAPVYLDNSATTRLAPEVLEAMLPWMEAPANSGSLHRLGRAAKVALERAREQVAAFLGAAARDIVFTSGGTESDALAVLGRAREGGMVVCAATEHPAVLESMRAVARRGQAEHRILAVDKEGQVSMAEVREILQTRPAVLAIMYGNNETGVLPPMAAIAQEALEAGVLLHADAVQAAPFMPLDSNEIAGAFVAISGHKIHGPHGTGALRVVPGWPLEPVLFGGGQERGRRAGTVNLAGAVGLGAACALIQAGQAAAAAKVAGLREQLEGGLLAALPETWVNGGSGPRLPHISNLGFGGVDNEDIMLALDHEGIAVSTGAACAAGSAEASAVLRAMGQDHETARSAIRFSLSRYTTEPEIEQTIAATTKVVQRLRGG